MSQPVAKTKSGKPISKKPSVHNSIKKTPFQVIEGDKGLEILSMVKGKLSKAFSKKTKINWREIQKEKLARKAKREKVKKLKEEMKQKYIEENDVDVNMQAYFVLGFNEVVRSLQTNLNTDSILVSSNFPEKLSHILVSLCKVRDVRLVGIKKLDVVTRESLGFPCSVLAVLTGVDCTFTSDIVQKIRSIEMDSNETSERMSVSESEQESTVSADLKAHDQNIENVGINQDLKKTRNLLLKRNSKNKRAFMPLSGARLESGESKAKKLKTSFQPSDDSKPSNYCTTQM